MPRSSTRRGDPPPLKSPLTLPKLPAPVSLPLRAELDSAAPSAKEQPRALPTVADACHAAAEVGTAGRLALDWEVATNGGQLAGIVSEFARTGFHQREGRGPAAATIVFGRQGRRLIASITRPGRGDDRTWFEPEIGAEASIANPAALRWSHGEIEALRDAVNLPTLALFDPDVQPGVISRELQEQLESMAPPGVCIAVITDYPGLRPGRSQGGGVTAFFPGLRYEPRPQDIEGVALARSTPPPEPVAG